LYIDKNQLKNNDLEKGVKIMVQKEFPILEFDEDINAFIRPLNIIQPLENMPEKCVLCFFSDAIEKILMEY